jgi:hypothetical protein
VYGQERCPEREREDGAGEGLARGSIRAAMKAIAEAEQELRSFVTSASELK